VKKGNEGQARQEKKRKERRKKKQQKNGKLIQYQSYNIIEKKK